MRSIRRSLGPIRNADVRVIELRALERKAPAKLRPEVRAYRRMAAGEAAGLRGEGPGLAVNGVTRRLQRVRETLAPFSGDDALALGRKLLADRAAGVRRALGRARGGSSEALHALRIAMKKHRYTLELLDDAGVAGLEPAILDARRIQDRLGFQRDQDQLARWIRSAAQPSPELVRHLERIAVSARAAALRATGVRAPSRGAGRPAS